MSEFYCRLCGARDPDIYMWEKQWVRRRGLTFAFVEGEPKVDDWGYSDGTREVEDAKAEQEWWCAECGEGGDTIAELIEGTGWKPVGG